MHTHIYKLHLTLTETQLHIHTLSYILTQTQLAFTYTTYMHSLHYIHTECLTPGAQPWLQAVKPVTFSSPLWLSELHIHRHPQWLCDSTRDLSSQLYTPGHRDILGPACLSQLSFLEVRDHQKPKGPSLSQLLDSALLYFRTGIQFPFCTA